MEKIKSSEELSVTRFYCTLFNKKYLIKGLAMYQSLKRYSKNFSLFILCMDEESFKILNGISLDAVVLIKLSDFENEELLRVKKERTIAEYCWTCAPCLLDYVFERNKNINFLTYLDADLLFYSSPEPIYREVGNASSVIVEHRFSPKFQESIINGKYNVQWVGIRRDVNGIATLKWWKERCIEWCFYRLEENRMGDQKYLDEWTTRFNQVHELQHIGAGVAPWNFANYRIVERNEYIFINDIPLIFYHFHSFRMLEEGKYVAMPSIYSDGNLIPDCIYDKYNTELLKAKEIIRSKAPYFSEGIEKFDDIPISRPTTLTIKNEKNVLIKFFDYINIIKRLLNKR